LTLVLWSCSSSLSCTPWILGIIASVRLVAPRSLQSSNRALTWDTFLAKRLFGPTHVCRCGLHNRREPYLEVGTRSAGWQSSDRFDFGEESQGLSDRPLKARLPMWRMDNDHQAAVGASGCGSDSRTVQTSPRDRAARHLSHGLETPHPPSYAPTGCGTSRRRALARIGATLSGDHGPTHPPGYGKHHPRRCCLHLSKRFRRRRLARWRFLDCRPEPHVTALCYG
jgi:hypothetical protein